MLLRGPSATIAGMENTPILICYDGSPGAVRAIEVAAALLGSRRAVVLDVAPPLTAAESLAAIGPLVPGSAFEDMNASAARQRADQGAQFARSSGFTAEPRGEAAAPTWEAILDVADEIDAAVVVIGSRGLTGVRELVEGSLSHQVAEHARRPVLIVPPSHDER
jgi:nucleotide-binding universal stress UspA family protein